MLKLYPIPGIEFIKLFIEEYGENNQNKNIKEQLVEAYIPIFKNHINDMKNQNLH